VRRGRCQAASAPSRFAQDIRCNPKWTAEYVLYSYRVGRRGDALTCDTNPKIDTEEIPV